MRRRHLIVTAALRPTLTVPSVLLSLGNRARLARRFGSITLLLINRYRGPPKDSEATNMSVCER